MSDIKLNTIILAGGKGTRMKSDLPKVLHKVYDRCIINYVFDSCKEAGSNEIYVIVGHKAEQIINHMKDTDAIFCIQDKQLGTGHAALQAEKYINDDDYILIVNGDMPLIKSYTIKSFISFMSLGNYDGALVSAVFDKTPAYGRVIRDSHGNLSKIIEQKDCNEDELAVEEVNIGLYCFKGKYLKNAFSKLDNNNAQKEYYITDIPYHIIQEGGKIGVYMIQDASETQGINSRADLSVATKTLLEDTRNLHMESGVTLIDPENTYISIDAKIGKDTVIYPGTNIQGDTIIGEHCVIGPNSNIIASTIGNNVVIETSKVDHSKIGDNCSIGPFANIRPKTKVDNSCKIGRFVETKNTIIGENSNLPHHIYVGDTQIGKNVEIACGVITANMNIKYEKNTTVIKDNAFIGCNSTLVAPVTIGEKAIVAAGSVVTENVSDKGLAIARSRQTNKENYNN
ncbi:MAG: bifunctional UDP-N-acetylglucosamine diphosphorylase/glucosamine-1-phosphate N-acetyltransferase GlmU [Clostridia bacterium]|nr:bifunctional UDP-N-acetylglucosamine diphosphorylase/glucosamine-1-phosphate N-acetyltransferase GlmU [Clostridia bacterium]